MWSRIAFLASAPWFNQGLKLVAWWGLVCAVALLLITASHCNAYRLTTFGVHRISQSAPTKPSEVKQAKVTAKPLLFTPTAQQLRFVVGLDTADELPETLIVQEIALTDNRQKQYRFPDVALGGLMAWEQEAVTPSILQDNKTRLLVLYFAPPVPDEARLGAFRLKFVATFTREGASLRFDICQARNVMTVSADTLHRTRFRR